MDRKKSLVIGPRTHKDILKGRNIRKHEDGGDMFEDYWTDSDGESSCHSKKSDQYFKSLHKDAKSDSLEPAELGNKKKITQLETEENTGLSENEESPSSINEENGENVAGNENEKKSVSINEENTAVRENEENVAVRENEENVALGKKEENAVIGENTSTKRNKKNLFEKQNVIEVENQENIAEVKEASSAVTTENATYILKLCNENTNQMKQNSETSFQTQENLLDETVTMECVSQYKNTREIPNTTYTEFHKDTQECASASAVSKPYTRKDVCISENGQKSSKKSILMVKNKKTLEMEEILSHYDEYDAKIMQMIYQENDSDKNVLMSPNSNKKRSSTRLSILSEKKQIRLNTYEGNGTENNKSSPSHNKRISKLHDDINNEDVDKNVHDSPVASKTVSSSQISNPNEKKQIRLNKCNENKLEKNKDSSRQNNKRISVFHNIVNQDSDQNVHKSPTSNKVTSTQPQILSEKTRLSTHLQVSAEKKQTRSITRIQNDFENSKLSTKSKNQHNKSCNFSVVDSEELVNNCEISEKSTIKSAPKSNLGKKSKVIEIISNISNSLDVSLSNTMTRSKTASSEKNNEHSNFNDNPSNVQNENVALQKARRNLNNSLRVGPCEHSFERDSEMNEQSTPIKCSIKGLSEVNKDVPTQADKKQKAVANKKYMCNNNLDKDVSKEKEVHISSKNASSPQPVLPQKRQTRSNTCKENESEISKNNPIHNKRSSVLDNNTVNDVSSGNMHKHPVSSKKIPTQLPIIAQKKRTRFNVCKENDLGSSKNTVSSKYRENNISEFCAIESPGLLNEKSEKNQSKSAQKNIGKKGEAVESSSLDDISFSKTTTKNKVVSKKKMILRNKHLSSLQNEENIAPKAKDNLDDSLTVDPLENLCESDTEMSEPVIFSESPKTKAKVSVNEQSSPVKPSVEDSSVDNVDINPQSTEKQKKDVNERISNIELLGKTISKKRNIHISKTVKKQKKASEKKNNPSTLPVNISEVNVVTTSPMQITETETTGGKEDNLMDQGQDFDKNHSPESEIIDDLSVRSHKKKKSLFSKGQAMSTDHPRRSNRQRFAPLARWRNERLMYRFEGSEIKILGVDSGTKEDDGAIKGMLKSLDTQKRKMHENAKPPKKAKLLDIDEKKSFHIHLHKKFSLIPWTTPVSGVPDENSSNEYLIKRMIETPKNAFGFLEIKSGKEKPPQYMPEEDLQLTVISGEVEIKVQKNIYKLNDKDMFIVPSNKAYSIKNVGMKKALLAFVVGKFKYLYS